MRTAQLLTLSPDIAVGPDLIELFGVRIRKRDHGGAWVPDGTGLYDVCEPSEALVHGVTGLKAAGMDEYAEILHISRWVAARLVASGLIDLTVLAAGSWEKGVYKAPGALRISTPLGQFQHTLEVWVDPSLPDDSHLFQFSFRVDGKVHPAPIVI